MNIRGDVFWQNDPQRLFRPTYVKEWNIKLLGCLLYPAIEVGTLHNKGEDLYVFRAKGSTLWTPHTEIISQVAQCDEALVCWPPK